jgi:integrase
MATGKVTVTSIDKLEGWLWDTACMGFGARRQIKGVFFYLRYRHGGRQVMHSIGRHGSPWTPDTARNEARRLLGIVATGVDPCAPSLSGATFGAEVERYLERKKASLKPRSFAETERFLRQRCAALHSLCLDQINRRKVAAWLGEIETSAGPVARNRGRSALSGFFNWCISEGLLDLSPVTGTAKAIENNSRERVLTQEELRQLWRTLGDGTFADIVRLLLLTGARRSEIGSLRWSEVDPARKQVVLPPERVKNGREFTLPLSTQALAILTRQPRRNSTDFVFNDRGYQDWDRGKSALDKRLPIAPWRLHDLRRTCATQLGELGVQPHHIEAILNHYSGHRSGVAGVYQRAKYSDEMRSALQRWADHIDKITA